MYFAGHIETTGERDNSRYKNYHKYISLSDRATGPQSTGVRDATILIWPAAYLGVQATYTVGTFTSYEARLLGKMATASGWNPYLGVGYLSVSKRDNVIGVSATFTDSTVCGVLGVEIPLSKRSYGYVEVAGASLDLKKIVTNGGQTVEATVEYAPVTIGAGLVYSLF